MPYVYVIEYKTIKKLNGIFLMSKVFKFNISGIVRKIREFLILKNRI